MQAITIPGGRDDTFARAGPAGSRFVDPLTSSSAGTYPPRLTPKDPMVAGRCREEWIGRRSGTDLTIRAIIQTHPRPTSLDREALVRCVTECLDCAATCTSCADACLAEPDVKELVRCIRLCLDCSDTCTTTGRVVTRQTEADLDVLRHSVETCAAACRASADECDRHASHHEHCRLCAESCRRCETACNVLRAAIG
jgi:Domain of Unknown Function (DUF326)